jgi:hypothetical protein
VKNLPLALAAGVLATGCAGGEGLRQPQVVQASPQMVTIEGTPLVGSSDTVIYALANVECRRQGRKHAALHKADKVRVHPTWYFHCVN